MYAAVLRGRCALVGIISARLFFYEELYKRRLSAAARAGVGRMTLREVVAAGGAWLTAWWLLMRWLSCHLIRT